MGKKRKGRKWKKYSHTLLIARMRPCASSRPAVSFAQQRKQNTKFDWLLNIMSRSHHPPSEKETILSRFQIQIKVKKKSPEVNRANIICRKKLKQKGAWLSNCISTNAARLIKASRIFVAVLKKLTDIEKSKSHSWLFDCHPSRARNIKKAAAFVNWLAPEQFQFNLFLWVILLVLHST